MNQIEHYADKPRSYYGNPRADYVSLLPSRPEARVLELGCGDGATGAMALDAGKAGEYVGIELFEPMAAVAAQRLTRVHVGDVATLELPYPPDYFDAFIASEVMEHLVDPWAVIAKIAPLLKPGALVLASSPNIAGFENVVRLLRGDWEYQDTGMMDRTHLRWFTPRSFEALFAGAGIVADSVQPLVPPTGFSRVLKRLFRRHLGHLFFFQINFRGHKALPGTAAHLTGRSR